MRQVEEHILVLLQVCLIQSLYIAAGACKPPTFVNILVGIASEELSLVGQIVINPKT